MMDDNDDEEDGSNKKRIQVSEMIFWDMLESGQAKRVDAWQGANKKKTPGL
jgi:hypothetical protein